MVRDVRVTRRPKQNRIHTAQFVQPALRHHFTVSAVPVTAPAKIFKIKRKAAASRGQCFKHCLAGRHDFFADAITGNAGYFVGLHGYPSRLRVSLG